jgi:hypothetical protein
MGVQVPIERGNGLGGWAQAHGVHLRAADTSAATFVPHLDEFPHSLHYDGKTRLGAGHLTQSAGTSSAMEDFGSTLTAFSSSARARAESLSFLIVFIFRTSRPPGGALP